MTIVDPHIRIDKEYYVYFEGKQKNIYVKDENNKNYKGKCWPG